MRSPFPFSGSATVLCTSVRVFLSLTVAVFGFCPLFNAKYAGNFPYRKHVLLVWCAFYFLSSRSMKALTLLVAAFSSSIMSVKRHTSLRLWVVSPTLFVCRNQSNCRHQGSSPSGWLCSPPCMFFQTEITSNYWNLAPLFCGWQCCPPYLSERHKLKS